MPTSDLSALLRPRSVAVIGASSRRGTIGAEIFHNLISNDFGGPVYPVNRKARAVQSVRAWPDIASVPDEVDLAVIAVPRDHVLGVVEECAAKGVKAAIVITAGFKEAGEIGTARERQIVEVARAAGMRLVGPNCLGVVSTDPETRLDATFAPTYPPTGTVAVASQSGALGVALLDYARELHIGVSDFVSMGNKADVSANDLIEWWGEDPATKVILLYMESFGNPARFAAIARKVNRTRPIVAVKSGRSTRGLLAASSHTGSLAGADRAVEALVKDTGLIRVDTVEQLFDMAAFLAHQPVPKGNRIGIVTNAGGPGILATDAAEAFGLVVPDLPDAVRDELASFLPPEASLRNPVDMIASATPEQFERACRLLLGSGAIDALLVLFVPPIVTDPTEVGAAIGRAALSFELPVISCFMGRKGVPEALRGLERARIPSYAFPETGVRVLSRAVAYGAWCDQPVGVVPELPDFDGAAVCGIVEGAQGPWLDADEVDALLAAAGIRTPRGGVARTAGEAAEIARAQGFPVVLKLVSKTITHKSDLGGVKVDLRNETDVFAAWESIVTSLSAQGLEGEMDGVLVQRMVRGGVETIIGMSRDPEFGPLVMFGLGGVHVELLKDVAFRLAPLTDVSAAALVRGVKGFPLLTGWRGAPHADVAALEDVLHRISAIAVRCARVAELDLNPVIALSEGVVAVDCRVRVSQVHGDAHPEVR